MENEEIKKDEEKKEINDMPESTDEKESTSFPMSSSKECTSSFFCQKSREKYIDILVAILALLFLYNIFTLWQVNNNVNIGLVALEEAAIPLHIDVTIITASLCDDCYDIHTLVPVLKKFNVNITGQNEYVSNSTDAQALIQKYSLTKVPAIIVTTTQASAKEKEDVMAELEKIFTKFSETELVYENSAPPYLDVASAEVKGRVTVISLTAPDCKECQNISSIIPALKKILTITDVKEVAYNSASGQMYLKEYGLDFAPTIILSKDAEAYDGFAATWVKYGTQEEDGSFVFRNTLPPYTNTTTNEVHGLVDIIYLTDESCSDCYNVTMHKQILLGFGMKFDKETTVDIHSEQGSALLEKYAITKVPTIILSSDAAAYVSLTPIWINVGEITEDGSYIFTSMDQLQGAKYTDLSIAEKNELEVSSDAGTETVEANETA